MIPVSLVVEGDLDESVLRRLLAHSRLRFHVSAVYGKQGKDFIRQNLPRYNRAAPHHLFIALADLDDAECPPALVEDWLPQGKHPRLIFRIAVREIEAWLLADTKGLAAFLGISTALLPVDPEAVRRPKDALVNLARQSRRRQIRADLAPSPNSTSRVGKNYAGRLRDFVENRWMLSAETLALSPSLEGAVTAIRALARHERPENAPDGM